MIIATIRFNVRKSGQKELTQAVFSLLKRIREMKGCFDCRLYRDFEVAKTLCLMTQWESQSTLSDFLKSDTYSILSGAIKQLCRNEDYTICWISKLKGFDTIEKIRQ